MPSVITLYRTPIYNLQDCSVVFYKFALESNIVGEKNTAIPKYIYEEAFNQSLLSNKAPAIWKLPADYFVRHHKALIGRFPAGTIFALEAGEAFMELENELQDAYEAITGAGFKLCWDNFGENSADYFVDTNFPAQHYILRLKGIDEFLLDLDIHRDLKELIEKLERNGAVTASWAEDEDWLPVLKEIGFTYLQGHPESEPEKYRAWWKPEGDDTYLPF